jgi:hypothetical protein
LTGHLFHVSGRALCALWHTPARSHYDSARTHARLRSALHDPHICIQDAYSIASRLASLQTGKFSTLGEAMRSYESARKPVVASLLAKSVLLGGVETLDGSVGSLVRDNFFAAMGAAGVAEKVLMDGATARV